MTPDFCSRHNGCKLIKVCVQESSFPRWCLDLPAASSWAPSVQSSTWTPSSSTPVSPDVGSASFALLRPQPVDFLPPSPQVNWASLRMTRGGSGPGGSASCCAVPYSSARLSSCSASLTPCRPGRRRRRGRTASTLCFLLLSVQTVRRRAPATGFCAATSLPTAPPAVSSSEVTAAGKSHHFSGKYLSWIAQIIFSITVFFNQTLSCVFPFH